MAAPEQAIGDGNLHKLRNGLECFFGERRGQLQVALSGQKIPTKNIAADLEAIQEIMPRLRSISGTMLVAEVRRLLMEFILTDEVRNKIAELCPELQIRESDIKDHHYQKGQEATDKAGSRMNGRNYLRGFLERYEGSVRSALRPEVANLLVTLENKVVSELGEEYRGVVTLIFHLTRGKIKIVERIIEAQLNGRGAAPAESHKEDEHFFDHLLEFLGIYADVTQELIEKSRQREEIQKRSDKTLTSILSHPHLQAMVESGTTKSINLFNELFLFFGGAATNRSPWFCGNLMHTPFDAEKLPNLIRRGVPREVLARVLLELNDYDHFASVREMRAVITEYERLRGTGSTPGKGVIGKINAILLAQNLITDKKNLQKMGLEEKIILIQRAIAGQKDPMETVHLSAGQPVSPKEVMIRVIHPKTIVKDSAAQAKFFELLDDLRALRGTSAMILRQSLADILCNDDPFLNVPLEHYGRRSIRELLTEFILDRFKESDIHAKTDPENGELPLLPLVDRHALEISAKELRKHFNTAGVGIRRGMLMKAAEAMKEVYDFETLLRFAQEEAELYLDTKEGVKKKYEVCYYPFATDAFRDLVHQCFPDLRPEDHVIISNQEYDGLTGLFPVERGIQADREDLQKAFEGVFYMIEGKPLEEVRQILERTTEIFFENHLHLGRDSLEPKEPEDALDAGVTQAVAEKLKGSVTPIEIHDLIKSKAPLNPSRNVRVVYLNDRQGSRNSKTMDQLFEEIKNQIDPQKTRMIVLSSKTRFGDAPCSQKEDQLRPNTYYLAQLIAKLKTIHPEIPIAIDACQALGRGMPDHLTKLKADIYLTSGHKALGTGAGALMALSEEFRKTSIGSRFEYQPSSLPIENIVAMGLGMHMLRQRTDFMRLEGNFGESRKKPLAQKIAHHMAKLTSHAIDRALHYGEQFVSHLTDERKGSLKGRTSVGFPTLFGCRVIYPVHRNFQDYTGVLTLALPTMNGRKLKNKLEAKGYKVIDCLKAARAIRISFHYLHDPADIDALFEAIQEVQTEDLDEQLKTQGAPPIRHDVDWIHD